MKRRGVFHAAAVYAAAAWVVFEVAEGAFPRLGLPDWTVTLVLVLAILGFPLALVLAWAFDLTSGRLTRVDGTEGTKVGSGSGDASAPAVPEGWPPGRIAAVGGAVVLALAGAAFLVSGSDDHEVAIDADAVAILPFRVSADPSLGYLREGMVDLMAAKLTGEGGPRAVDSRTTLVAWREAVPHESADLSRDAALRVSRRVGAGKMLLGEVVGTPDEVTISATVYDTETGAGEGHSVTGPATELTTLVDRLAAELLAMEAGEATHRLATLTSASLPALRAFLAGQVAFRQGRFEDAAEHFLAAVDADSTFALAGLALAKARGWTGYGPDYDRGLRLAWAGKDRLSERDRLLVEAQRGPSWPEPTPPREWLDAWDRAVAASPNSPEAWYGLGDRYFHSGFEIGFIDWQERARGAFERSVALDSTYGPSVNHLISLAMMRGDTAGVRRLARRYFSMVGEEERYTTGLGWQVAMALGDTAGLRRIRENFDRIPMDDAGNMTVMALYAGLPFDDPRELLERFSTSPDPNRTPATWMLLFLELNTGRTSAVPGLLERLAAVAGEGSAVFMTVGQGLILDGDSTLVDGGLQRMEALYEAGDQPSDFLCSMAAVEALRGEVERADSLVEAGRRELAADPGDSPDMDCGWASGFVAAARGDPIPAEVVRALDETAIERADPFLSVLAARLAEAAGETDRALDAARRASAMMPVAATGLLMRARLAAGQGLGDEATEAYRSYLVLRREVEPGTRAAANVAAARRELAGLVGEG